METIIYILLTFFVVSFFIYLKSKKDTFSTFEHNIYTKEYRKSLEKGIIKKEKIRNEN